jgi:uncharacterized protein
MDSEGGVIATMRERAREAQELHERSRRMLVGAARAGASAGLTQRQISEAIGRSQPEVSRLLRFHGRTVLGRALETKRIAIISAAAEAGAKNVRVFGSVSRGEDAAGSDIDLLVDLSPEIGLFALGRLEMALSEILGAPVDVIPAASLRANLRDQVLAEAVSL